MHTFIPLSSPALRCQPCLSKTFDIQSNYTAFVPPGPCFLPQEHLRSLDKVLSFLLPLGISIPCGWLCRRQPHCIAKPLMFDRNTSSDLQLGCRLRQYWENQLLIFSLLLLILMFAKIKDDSVKGRILQRTYTWCCQRLKGSCCGLIATKLLGSILSIKINLSSGQQLLFLLWFPISLYLSSHFLSPPLPSKTVFFFPGGK